MNDHKLEIFSLLHYDRRRWYTDCECGWQAPPRYLQSSAAGYGYYYGRATWAEAFDAGIHHQRFQQFLTRTLPAW